MTLISIFLGQNPSLIRMMREEVLGNFSPTFLGLPLEVAGRPIPLGWGVGRVP
jgi:hypothetical protein